VFGGQPTFCSTAQRRDLFATKALSLFAAPQSALSPLLTGVSGHYKEHA
jgi:hypothetical protein